MALHNKHDPVRAPAADEERAVNEKEDFDNSSSDPGQAASDNGRVWDPVVEAKARRKYACPHAHHR